MSSSDSSASSFSSSAAAGAAASAAAAGAAATANASGFARYSLACSEGLEKQGQSKEVRNYLLRPLEHVICREGDREQIFVCVHKRVGNRHNCWIVER